MNLKTNRMKARAAKTAQRKNDSPWYLIKDAKQEEDRAEIFIFDEIGFFGVSAQDFIKELKEVKAKDIDLRINSPGGAVFDGMAIFNAIKRHPSNVVVHIEALAASIAGVIAMAGDEINMAQNSHLMIHSAWSFVIGNASEMRKEADLLDRVDKTIADIFIDRTGEDAEIIHALMDDETWFLADEAVEMGFADNVTGASEAENHFDLTIFDHTPTELQMVPVKEKVFENKFTKRAMEKTLCDVGLTNRQARAFVSGGYKAAGLRDADHQKKIKEYESILKRI